MAKQCLNEKELRESKAPWPTTLSELTKYINSIIERNVGIKFLIRSSEKRIIDAIKRARESETHRRPDEIADADAAWRDSEAHGRESEADNAK